MTDISDLREGDEIEIVVRARIGKPTSWAKDKTNGRLVYVNDEGIGTYFHERGLPNYLPLPAGLSPAMIVPAPATHDGPRRTVDAPAVHGGGRVVAE